MSTSTQAQAKHLMPGDGDTFRARGFLITFKLRAHDTGEAYTLSEAYTPPQTGVPPHIQHLEDESFVILEGTLRFQVGEERFACGPGEVVYVPRGTPHAFHNDSAGPARLLIIQSPGGIHEQYFAEAWERIADLTHLPPEPPTDFGKVKAAAEKHGIEILPPPGH